MDQIADTASRNLHLGCGHNRLEGWLNCDLYPTSATDMLFDLEKPWPIATASQAQILASHVVEHLHDWETFFKEAWRVLIPDGLLYLRVPYGGHAAAWWDFGHIRPYFAENFVLFQPGYAAQVGNPQHQGWQWPYNIEMIDVRVSTDVVRLFKALPFKWLRNRLFPYLRQGAWALEELFVRMRPLKSQEAVRQWIALNHPNVLRVQYVCWRHIWLGQPLPRGQDPQLHVLGVGCQLNGYN